MSYRIKTASELVGVPKNTLIAWERRYQVVDPERTSSGYRVYSDADVAILKRVRELTEQGYKAGEACRLVKRDQMAPAPAQAVSASGEAALTAIRVALQDRLLAFDREGADRVVMRLLMVPFERCLDEVYFPLLHDVGDCWQAGTITVVQEHYVTAFCREKLLVMLHSVQAGIGSAPEITCATPPGEHHELGLLAVALRLVLRGYRVVYLGTNVPTAALCQHVEARRPAGLCLSMVHAHPEAELVDYARELRRRVPKSVPIAIGGRAVAEASLPDIPGVTFCGHVLPPWLTEPARARTQG